MRILAIRGERLASLYAPFEVDFEAPPLAGAGLFAIVGPTGAGKSTLLDALCLALFGETPRSTDQRRGLAISLGLGEGDSDERLLAGDPRQILSRGSREGRAEVEFVGQDGVAYRATWTVRRRPSSQALDEARMSLVRTTDGAVLVERKLTEARRQNERLVGFSFEEFQKAVLLPQGQFAEFLHAAPTTRAEILEKVAGGEIYASLGAAAAARQRIEQERLDSIQLEAQGLRPLDDEPLAATIAARDMASAEVAAVQALLQAARGALAEAESAARSARRADEEASLAQSGVGSARTACEAHERERDEASAWLAARTSETPVVTEWPRWREQVERHRKALAAAATARKARDQAATPEAVEMARREAAGAVSRRDEAALASAAAATARGAAERALHEAEGRLEESRRALQRAREIQGLAGRRTELRPGEPCPLCGATDHPWAGSHEVDALVAVATEANREREAVIAAAKSELVRTRAVEEGAGRAAAAAVGDATARVGGLRILEEELARAGRAAAEREVARAEGEARECEARLAEPFAGVAGWREALAADPAGLVSGWERRAKDHATRRAALEGATATLAKVRQALAGALATAQERAAAAKTADERLAAARSELARVVGGRAIAEVAGQLASADGRRIAAEAALLSDATARAALAALAPRIDEQRTRAALWARLGKVIGGGGANGFQVFAQGLALDALLGHANRHLEQLAPRYQLARVPGTDMELQLHDQELGGAARGVNSLSGGETFLVSLGLALGLSGLATRAARVESLFVDEGFGTLDPETLDQAMAVLEALRATGRTVGVISHVPELHDRIGVLVLVEKLGAGRSRVRSVRLGG